MLDRKAFEQQQKWKIEQSQILGKQQIEQNGDKMTREGTQGQEVNQKSQVNNAKVISFQEVVSQNLSNLYQSIVKSHQPPQDKHLLPVNSNLQRKPSLLYPQPKSTRTSRYLTSRIKQKQNSALETLTQKHVRINSQNAIKYFPEEDNLSSQIQERNPEESFQNVERLLTDLSREFMYVGDFSLIRKQIVELALERKLQIVQNTNEFVTTKVVSRLDYCQCLIKSCFSSYEQTGGIYQLKNSIYKRNKAKFVLISGEEKGFLKFFRQILTKLWNKKKLKLKKKELVEFFVNVEKQAPQFKLLKKQYTSLYNELSGLSPEEKPSSNKSILSNIAQGLKRLRSPQKSTKSLPEKSKDTLSQITELNKKIDYKFTQLKKKLLTSQNLPQIDQQTVEKQLQTEVYFHELPVWKLFGFYYKKQFEEYERKKQEIVKSYSLKGIFSYLEIEEQYSLYLVQKGRIASQTENDSGQVHEKPMKSCQNVKESSQTDKRKVLSSTCPVILPYQQCIKTLQSLACTSFTPSRFLTSLLILYNQLQSAYTDLYSQKPIIQLSSMDDELPVTIFILLMADLKNSRSTSANLLGKVRWVMKWIQGQQLIKSEHNICVNGFRQHTIVTDKLQGFAQQKKILTTLQAAMMFVMKQWNQENIKDTKVAKNSD